MNQNAVLLLSSVSETALAEVKWNANNILVSP